MSLGRRLSAARTERGLSLEDVSRATRIRVPILAALESDDAGAAGPPAYVRGHLRTLAGLLGLDPVALVAEYERAAPSAPVVPQTWQVRDPAVARADRGSPSWLGAMVVTMAAVVALLVVGIVVEQPDDQVTIAGPGPQATAPAAPPPAAEGGGDAAPPVAGAEDEPAPGAPAPDDALPDSAGVTGGSTAGSTASGSTAGGTRPAATVRVRVAADEGRSWLEVVDASGKSLHAAVLESGDAEEFTSEGELRITVGDATAVRLEVDGRPVDVPGGAGDIARLRVRPGGAVTAG